MRPVGFPQTSVTKYQPTLCNIAEGRRSHLVGNLKSGFMCVFWWLSVVEEGCIYITKQLIHNVQSTEIRSFYEINVEKEISFTFKHEILFLNNSSTLNISSSRIYFISLILTVESLLNGILGAKEQKSRPL